MLIDLRSDTITRPTNAMREAMASAEVGDDVYGEDPTATRLEAMVAERLGHEAALFVPSGTMGNQLATMVHCRPGDDVIVGKGSHCVLYESGGSAALAGVQFSQVGEGLFSAADVKAAVFPKEAYYMPHSQLVWVENTHNLAGGVVWPLKDLEAVCGQARDLGLALHMDGARLWNAAAASGHSLEQLARPFDTVMVCFSKGLGAPVGSALVGSRAMIERARRLRSMFGGAMRQVGILCAGALHGLQHHLDRIEEDHQSAALLAAGLGRSTAIEVLTPKLLTNIVNFRVNDAASFVDNARKEGVLLNTIGPDRVRAVTHLDVSVAQIERAVHLLCAEAEA